MPPVGFEPMMPASAEPQTHTWHRAAAGIGEIGILFYQMTSVFHNVSVSALVGGVILPTKASWAFCSLDGTSMTFSMCSARSAAACVTARNSSVMVRTFYVVRVKSVSNKTAEGNKIHSTSNELLFWPPWSYSFLNICINVWSHSMLQYRLKHPNRMLVWNLIQNLPLGTTFGILPARFVAQRLFVPSINQLCAHKKNVVHIIYKPIKLIIGCTLNN
jgi:hypothetical protein